MNDDMFYVDYDDETDMFYVVAYDDRPSFVYSTWLDKEMAEEDAAARNRDYKIANRGKR